MQPEPKFFLEGKQFVVFWHRSGDRNDPLDFFDSLPVKTRLTLAGTIQSYADEGKVTEFGRAGMSKPGCI